MKRENPNRPLFENKIETVKFPMDENIESQLATIKKEAESFWKNMAEKTEKQKLYYESGLMKEKLGEKEEANRLFELELAKLEHQIEEVEKTIEQMKEEAEKQSNQFFVEIQKEETFKRKFELIERKVLATDKFGKKEEAKEIIMGKIKEAEENKISVLYNVAADKLEKLGYENLAKEIWEKAGKQCEEKSLYEKAAQCYEKEGENFQGKAMEMWRKVIEEGGRGDKKLRKKMEERGSGTGISTQDFYETALAYDKLGDSQKAAEKFGEIVEKYKNNENSKNLIFVAMAYEKLGEKDKALKMWEIMGEQQEKKNNFGSAGKFFEMAGKPNLAIEMWKNEVEKIKREKEMIDNQKDIATRVERNGYFGSAGKMRGKISEESSLLSVNNRMIYAYDKLIELLEKKGINDKKITIE